MSGVLRIALYIVGALALLVVVNWARQELLIGLGAACVAGVAAMLLSRSKKAEEGARGPARE